MTIAIVLILACCASVVFGVGYVCGRGLRREEAMREEMNERTP